MKAFLIVYVSLRRKKRTLNYLVSSLDVRDVIVMDMKHYRRYQQSLCWTKVLFVTILCIEALAACVGQPLPDRALTNNGAIIADGTPTAAHTARSKVIKPIEVITNQSRLISYANGKMNLTITSSPYAICNFIVSYGMGMPSRAFGIKPATADAHGLASWTWQVEGKAPTGRWPLKITATLVNGAQTSRVINVLVTLPPMNLDGTKSTLSVARKAEATLAVATAPLVNCTMTIGYTSRIKTLKGIADSKGNMSWTWKVETGVNPGIYPLIVTIITGSGEQEKATFDIIIK
jgi:hypothetical protein